MNDTIANLLLTLETLVLRKFSYGLEVTIFFAALYAAIKVSGCELG
jgi:hypothetical protein